MKYQLAIFDLDGTILDTLKDLTDSVNHSLGKYNCPERSIDEIRNFVGNGILTLIKRSVPNNSDDVLINNVYEDFCEYYKEHNADSTKEYDGITELFLKLRSKGIKIAVVSNKADFAVKSLCKKYFDGLIDVCIGERTNVRRKPAPDSVNEVLSQFETAPENAVYIGDSNIDILTAKNACTDCISVSWGFRDTEFLKKNGASVIVRNVRELYDKIVSEN